MAATSAARPWMLREGHRDQPARARIAFVLLVSIAAVVAPASAVAIRVLGPRGPDGFLRSVATQIEMLMPHLNGRAARGGVGAFAMLHEPTAGAPRQQLTRTLEAVLREAGILNRVVVTRPQDMPQPRQQFLQGDHQGIQGGVREGRRAGQEQRWQVRPRQVQGRDRRLSVPHQG